MRDLPIIFPISLAIILILVFFTGAYAISAGAVPEQPVYTSTPGSGGAPTGDETTQNSWFEQGAIFVCPFH